MKRMTLVTAAATKRKQKRTKKSVAKEKDRIWKNMEDYAMKKKRNVVRMLLTVVCAFLIVLNAGAVKAEAKTDKKVAILYFSASGNTETVAKKIQKSTKGKIMQIKPSQPYTKADLVKRDKLSRTSIEHYSAPTPAQSKIRPAIKNLKQIRKTVKSAKVVYIGYPIWWGDAPHILYNLVEKIDLREKTVVLFCTSGHNKITKSAKGLKSCAVISDETKWLAGKNFKKSESQNKIDKWITSMGI